MHKYRIDLNVCNRVQEQLVLLRECIMIRDNVFTLPNFYTIADVQCVISYVCSLG